MSYLHDIGPEAVTHRQEVDAVKRQLGITHDEFDCWIYGFLENKKFNIEETVAKVQRRFAMEINELATYEFNDYMRQGIRNGTIQVIGEDKQGRVTFYVVTRRDKPTSAHRDDNRRTFDMMVSYGTRLRADNKRCQMAMLINQDKASLWSNIDMRFQADIALRIAKFYPGGVDKMYICNMNRTLAAMAKPIFSRLPPIVSDRIIILDDAEIKRGALLELYDESVLPVDLGGRNDCDNQECWNRHGDTIEEYYASLKRAIVDRGISVKEWELEQIGFAPRKRLSYLSGSYNTSHHTSKMPEVEPLRTCVSVRDDSFIKDENDEYGANGTVLDENTSVDVDSWQRVVSPFPRNFAVFFLDELLRWRLATEETELVERYALLDRYASARRQYGAALPEIDLNDKKWYSRVPRPLRDISKLCLVGLTALNAAYFLGALIFLSVLTSTIVVTLFFGCFVHWNFIFPLGATLAMAAVQGFALCSRAVDVVFALLHRKVIPPFERFGTLNGGIAQMSLFGILAMIQFIIFCVYAVDDAPLKGLQASFATGWLSAVFIVSIFHLFYFLDWMSSPQRGPNVTGPKISLAFFMLFDMEDAEEEHQIMLYPIRTSSYVICGIPIFISMFLGIGFLISRIVALAVCTCIASIVAAFTVNYCSLAISNTVSSSILRITLWIATVVWLFDCYAFGFRNYAGIWGASVIVSSIITGWIILVALVCLKVRGNKILTRVAIVELLILLLGCWVACFPTVGWKIGVFCIVMILHSMVSSFLSRHDLTNIGGVFVLSAAILLLIVSCTLLGWHGTSPQTVLPRSLPSGSTPATVSSIELYHRYPVCGVRVAGGLDITDLSLLTELVNSDDVDVFTADMSNWFGSTDVVYAGLVRDITSGSQPWFLHQFNSFSMNATVLVLQNRYALSSIMTMSIWIGSVALSPLHIFLPTNWATRIVDVISFVTNMINFGWFGMRDELAEYLESLKITSDTEIILTSSGVAGGLASMAGASSRTQTVVFGSPGLMHILHLADIGEEDYHRYVLAVGASNGVIDNVGGHDITIKQKLHCTESALRCLSMDFISSELLKTCQTSGRRHV